MEVLPDIFKVEIPLPQNPLKSINSYIIKSPERNLIIDTGMNREECKTAIIQALAKLEIDLDKTDFFVTHLHSDHYGLVSHLASDKSQIYISAEAIKYDEHFADISTFGQASGFPEANINKAISSHFGKKYAAKTILNYVEVKGDDLIKVGNYCFRCIWTPGHTKGHMCLYEPTHKVLFSGDHLLDEITPNLSLSLPEQGNPLKDYLSSLDKVYELEIDLVLPGHRNIFTDYKRRISEIKHHHELRLNEILIILEKSPGSAYFVASKMVWGTNYSSWESFPVQQKWFATGEANSHLKYLEEKGEIQKQKDKQSEIEVYSLCQ